MVGVNVALPVPVAIHFITEGFIEHRQDAREVLVSEHLTFFGKLCNQVNSLFIGQRVACDHPAADRINRCPNRPVRVVMLDHRLVDTHRESSRDICFRNRHPAGFVVDDI